MTKTLPNGGAGKSLPRGIRNNNPGNLRKSKDKWQGLAAQQTDKAFFQFKDPSWGIRAVARTLITYQDRYGATTVRKIITRWAPPAENDTQAYIRSVARAIDVTPDEKINVHDYAVMRPLVEAIIVHENGLQPYGDAVVDKGLILAGVEPPMQPMAKTRTAKGATIAAAGGVATAAGAIVEQVEPAFPLLHTALQIAPWVAAVLVLAGVAWIVWARLDDRRRGLR